MEDGEEHTPCQGKRESPRQMGQAWWTHENWNRRPFQTQQKQEACRDEQGQSREREKRNRLFRFLFASNVSPEALALSCCQIHNPAWAPGRWVRQILETSSGATQRGWTLGHWHSCLTDLWKYGEESSLLMCSPAVSQGFWLDPTPKNLKYHRDSPAH